MDVIKLLQEKAEQYPAKPAFIHSRPENLALQGKDDNGRSVSTSDKPRPLGRGSRRLIFKDQQVTFSSLRDTVFKLARGLKELGIKKGDKLVIYLPNCPEYIYSYLAIWCCGATAVPLDFMLTQDELSSCLLHSESKAIILKPKAGISLTSLREACPGLKNIITCLAGRQASLSDDQQGCLNFRDLLKENQNEIPSCQAEDKDYAIIFYTSGTTGKPKGVLINYLQLGAPPKSMEYFVNLQQKEIALCALPFSHLGGLIYIQNCLSYAIIPEKHPGANIN